MDGVLRNFNGKVDFAVWYGSARDRIGTNLVAIEAGHTPMPRLHEYVKPDPLIHRRRHWLTPSSVIHHRRRELAKQNRVAWGMATDGHDFY
jgi:hypothetical protein